MRQNKAMIIFRNAKRPVKIFSFLGFFAFIFFSVAPAALAGAFEDGLKAYNAKNYTKALELFLIDAKAGKAEAQLEAGKLLHTNFVGSRRNNEESAKWVRAAAEQGYPPAQSEVGYQLWYGAFGFTKDRNEARKWWAAAAEQGYAEAPYVAAKAMEFGTPAEPREAVSWYHVAADLGHAEAQYWMGIIYFCDGYQSEKYGVEVDLRAAEKWLLLSAKQGNTTAQIQLGYRYFTGKGVLQSYEEGYAWWIVASANGSAEAKRWMDKKQEKMTPGQMERAQQRAKQIWLDV